MARVLSEGDEGMNDEPGGARSTPAAVTDQTRNTGIKGAPSTTGTRNGNGNGYWNGNADRHGHIPEPYSSAPEGSGRDGTGRRSGGAPNNRDLKRSY